MADDLTAQVDGLIPYGSARIRTVDLHAGQVWSVGRADPVYLSGRPDRGRWHLAVPGAGLDMSVNQLELRVGAVGVSVTGRGGAGVTVDGVVRPSPVVLTRGTNSISPTTAGSAVDFAVRVLRAEKFADRSDALRPSGTTISLVITIEVGSALARVAHALSWPCMPTRRRPIATGWSGREVAQRMAQLGWQAPSITVVGQQLITLADKVENCRVSTGRRADAVFPMWPPWLEEEPGETRDQRAERRNRCVAEVLWRAGAVSIETIEHPTG